MATDRVYFDTCVFLAVFLEEDGRLEFAKAALTAAEQGITEGFISALVVAESIGAASMRAPNGGSRNEEEEMRLHSARDYFLATGFTYIEAAPRSAHLAMQHAVDYELKGPDALHLALAQMAGCTQLHTYDDGLLKVGTSVPGLAVMKPYGNPQLYFEDL